MKQKKKGTEENTVKKGEEDNGSKGKRRTEKKGNIRQRKKGEKKIMKIKDNGGYRKRQKIK